MLRPRRVVVLGVVLAAFCLGREIQHAGAQLLAASSTTAALVEEDDEGCPLPPAAFDAIKLQLDPTQCSAERFFDNRCQESCVCEMVKKGTA